MKTRIALFTVSMLAAGALLAQEPVMGVKDPESLFKDSDPVLNRNKQAAMHIERELLQCHLWNRAGEWLTDAYHQHNPNAQSGLKGVVYYFTQVAGQKPMENCGALTAPVVHVIAEGDLVTVMTARTGEAGGKKYYTTWFDTWRFVDGKADEHWDPDVLHVPPPK